MAHGNVSGALGGMFGHRLGKAFQEKAESSTTPRAGDIGAQGGGLSDRCDAVGRPTETQDASQAVPADYNNVERNLDGTECRGRRSAMRGESRTGPARQSSRAEPGRCRTRIGLSKPRSTGMSAPRKEHR